ncbi:MAG: NAD-dependent epimerase/dehydratase family protein, partial [Anaerolineales bacterium]|nr:NAD-dependent epimerase/dehydratase family protein [Anaerolineales bacterium]
MQILIAGGSGLLGTALKKSLIADGHRVRILSRRDAPGIVKWDGRATNGWG